MKTMKGVVGYDLTRIFVGSEGTLGVITKITLKLIPLPETKATILALFGDVEEAAKTVSAIIAARIVPSTIEFMDKSSVMCSEQASPMGLPHGRGRPSSHRDRREQGVGHSPRPRRYRRSSRTTTAIRCDFTQDPAESDRLWQARRALSQALYNGRPPEDRRRCGCTPSRSLPLFALSRP